MVLLIMMVVIVVILAEDLPEQNRLAQLCRPAASAQGLGAKDYTPEITRENPLEVPLNFIGNFQ